MPAQNREEGQGSGHGWGGGGSKSKGGRGGSSAGDKRDRNKNGGGGWGNLGGGADFSGGGSLDISGSGIDNFSAPGSHDTFGGYDSGRNRDDQTQRQGLPGWAIDGAAFINPIVGLTAGLFENFLGPKALEAGMEVDSYADSSGAQRAASRGFDDSGGGVSLSSGDAPAPDDDTEAPAPVPGPDDPPAGDPADFGGRGRRRRLLSMGDESATPRRLLSLG